MDVIEQAKRVLKVEAQSILDLAGRIDESFSLAVDLLFRCKGKVVVMGMGKSGLVGRKIASTFASTGTPAFFLHPAEGLNGDFGMLAKGDVVIAISNSGETRELVEVLPLIKRHGNQLITLSGNLKSILVPEVNRSGQFAAWVKAHTELPLISLNKYGGLPFTPGEIRAKVMEFLVRSPAAAEGASSRRRPARQKEVTRG